MPKLRYLLAAAATAALMTLPQTASAGPLGFGLTAAVPAPSNVTTGLVERVGNKRYYHRKGKYHRHRHHRRHHRRHFDDDFYVGYYPYYYYPYYSYFPYRRHFYPYHRHRYGGPFITFSFGG